MTTKYGQYLESLTSLDSALSVTAGNRANGSSKDIGANTSPQSLRVDAQFAITNAGSTDGYDLEVIVQFSDDDSNWPADGEGAPIASFYDSNAGADLAASGIFSFTPLLRYFRFQYLNNNGTDNLSVDSEVATQVLQDDS